MDISQFYNAALQESQWLRSQNLPAAPKSADPGSTSSTSPSFLEMLKKLQGLSLGSRSTMSIFETLREAASKTGAQTDPSASLLQALNGNNASVYDSALFSTMETEDSDDDSGAFQILQSANSQKANLAMLDALKTIEAKNPTAASVFAALLQGTDNIAAGDPLQTSASAPVDESVKRSEDALYEALLKQNSTGKGYLNALQALESL